MNIRIWVVTGAILALCGSGFGMVGAAQNGESGNGRFVAHTTAEVVIAKDRGCEVVKTGKMVTVLKCHGTVGEELGLQSDIRVFIQDVNVNAQIGANAVHASGNTGAGRSVAVLDTGYNFNHPELSSSYLGGYDFVNNDNNPSDDNGHGTHVGGIITADGFYITSSSSTTSTVVTAAKGTTPNSGVFALKVLDAAGSGFFSDIEEAIYWAVNGPDGVFGNADDPRVDAINMSLGTSQPYTYKGFCDNTYPSMRDAIKYAVDRGVTVVVAAGNSGNAGVSMPGCISYATTVGAVDKFDKVASFSGRGNAVDISAPGVSIYSTWLGSSYATLSGTSMATPVIAAVVALIKSAHPTYTPTQVQDALFKTAKELGKAKKDTSYGWGRVRADAAVGY